MISIGKVHITGSFHLRYGLHLMSSQGFINKTFRLSFNPQLTVREHLSFSFHGADEHRYGAFYYQQFTQSEK